MKRNLLSSHVSIVYLDCYGFRRLVLLSDLWKDALKEKKEKKKKQKENLSPRKEERLFQPPKEAYHETSETVCHDLVNISQMRIPISFN